MAKAYKVTAENYYSADTDKRYMSASLYKSFVGTWGFEGCEAHTMARLNGKWNDPASDAMLTGSYVDAWMDDDFTIGGDAMKHLLNENPRMFKKDGTLQAKFDIANTMIERVKRDEYFMNTLKGEHQVIMTGELFGAKWKIKMDSYHPHSCIVDLKTTKDISEKHWVADLGRINFIDYYGYDIQMAVYQEIVRQNTGEKLPVYISAVSKQAHPDITVIRMDQKKLDDALSSISLHMPRIIRVWKDGEEPTRCESCDYCKETKVLSNYIYPDEIKESV